MRRLIALIASVLVVETIFYSALGPLLPELSEEFDLSRWQAGVLGAANPVGVALLAIPGALLAMRVGVRAVVVAALALLAGSSVGFGLAGSFETLLATRLLQGAAGGLCWSACLSWLVSQTPRERRGEVLGLALSAAVVGALLGPVVGGVARAIGRPATFAAVAGLAVLLIAWALRERRPPAPERQPARTLTRALRSPTVLTAMWLVLLPAMLFGVLVVLGPLRLDAAGYGALGVTVVFVLAAALEAGVHPAVGRWSDRRGRLEPLRVGCVLAVAASLALAAVGGSWGLAVLIVATGIGYAVFWAPALALLADGTEAAGVGVLLGQSLLNLSFAPGNVIGSAVGGALADALGDGVPFVLVAGLCALTFAVLHPRSLRALRGLAGALESA
jgi:predicted MFS family arabinose efflux permease